jgi:hypothetical protein
MRTTRAILGTEVVCQRRCAPRRRGLCLSLGRQANAVLLQIVILRRVPFRGEDLERKVAKRLS